MNTFAVKVAHPATETTAEERADLIALLEECRAKWEALAAAAGTKGERRAKSEHKRISGRLEVFAVGYLRKLVGDVEMLSAELAVLQLERAKYNEWLALTDWVQDEFTAGRFPDGAGKHRATIMREEIERLRAAMEPSATSPRDPEVTSGIVPYIWPRDCTCNECGHTKTFANWEAIEAAPLCEQCGAHAFEGSGYCWCGMCGSPRPNEGPASVAGDAA